MKRLAKCRCCNELYRAVPDGRDGGICLLCIELDRAAQTENQHHRARRRDLLMGVVAGLMLAGGIAGFLFTREPAAAVARTGGPLLEIRTDPVAVDVYLDSKWTATSSLDGHLAIELPRGGVAAHWLEFRRVGYESQRRMLAMADLARPIAVLLPRAPIDTQIDSEPPGAAVWIAGEARGLTPLKMKFPADALATIPLRVVKDGYEPVQRSVPVPVPGQPLRFVARLEPAAPAVRIESQPPGATVMLDEKTLGVAPLTATLDAATRGQRITIRGKLAGYNATTADVEIPTQPGVTPKLSLHFDTPASALNIQTKPPGGLVWLNGRRLGRGPQRVELTVEDLVRPIRLEASLGQTHFGDHTVTPPTAGAEQPVTVNMTFVGRRVVLAVEMNSSLAARAVRERVKDEIQRLDPAQQFCVVAAAGAAITRSWNGWLTASSENKVRAYDFADQLRPAETEPDADILPRAVAGIGPDAAWFYLEGTPQADHWQRWFALSGPRICIVAGPEAMRSDWLATWVDLRRGTLEPLPTTQQASLDAPDGDAP